jgi:TRAP-type transport system small permease protein
VLFSLLVLTCADVFGRYVLVRPVHGKTEITRMLMAVMIALVLPVVTARKEHITVDLFDFFFRGRVQAVRDLMVDTLPQRPFWCWPTGWRFAPCGSWRGAMPAISCACRFTRWPSLSQP